MDFDETLNFDEVLQGIRNQRGSRDPRARRMAAAVDALVEVVGQQENSSVSAAQVYAQGMTALEGTLLRKTTDNSTAAVNELLGTQVALLETLSTTIPHVEPPQILAATLAVPSRVLRSLVSLCQSIESTALDTEDELGGISSVLRSVAKTGGQIALKLHNTTPDVKTLQQFWKGTTLVLLGDHRSKVRTSAVNAVLEPLVHGETCHAEIRRTTDAFVCRTLENMRTKIMENGGGVPAKDLQNLLPLISFLENYAPYIRNEKVLVEVMELLTTLIQSETEAVTGATATTTTTDFVTLVKQKKRTDGGVPLAVIASLLGVIHASLEEESDSLSWKPLFSSRVLASLLTAQPTWIFRQGVTDPTTIATGRIIWGQTMIIAVRQILDSENSMDAATPISKMLPLVAGMIFLLAKPTNEDGSEEDEASIAFPLIVDLTQFFREYLPVLKGKGLDSTIHAITLRSEQLLTNVFRPTWAVSLKCFAICLQHHCEDVAYVKHKVESLIQHRNDVTASAAAKLAVEGALSTLVETMGLSNVWSWVEWPHSPKTARERGWLLGIMRSGAQITQPFPLTISFFQNEVLLLARRFDKAVSSGPAIHKLENRIAVVETWKLLPCFFNQFPPDVSEHLSTLTRTMSKVLDDERYPELTQVICQSISLLSQSAEDHLEMHLTTLQSMPKVLLPLLFNICFSVSQGEPRSDDMGTEGSELLSGDNPELGQKLQLLGDTVCSLSRIADKSFLQSLFKKLMHRLLEEMQLGSPSEAKLSTYLLLSQSLVRSGTLDEGNISFLFRATKPLLHDGQHSTKTLKRAYKLLAEICEKYGSFFSEPQRLEELSSLMKETAGTTQVAARYMRLKCVSRVVEGLHDPTSTGSAAALSKILSATSEILICLKDPNGKTREAAYELLLAISAKSEYNTLLHILTASLAAETPHLRSAAVMALSRVVYELVNEREEVQASLPALLSTVLYLFAEESREVIKSVVGFTRVCVSSIPNDQLEPLLPELVGGLMKYNKVKERFRPKIKIILKKLVKRFGYDGIMPLVPKSEARLLKHMRKVDERSKRKKQMARDSTSETATKVAGFDTFLDSDEEDSDNGETLVSTIAGDALTKASSRKTKRTRMTIGSKRSRGGAETKVQIPAETDGNIVDMLGTNISKRVTFMDQDSGDDESSSDDEIAFNDDGMLLVREQTGDDKGEDHVMKKRRISRLESLQLSQQQIQKKKKTNGGTEQLGRAYKSRKAGGDVKRKDQKYEPYAFVPLNAKAYSKKNRRNAVASMSTVVRHGKKKGKY